MVHARLPERPQTISAGRYILPMRVNYQEIKREHQKHNSKQKYTEDHTMLLSIRTSTRERLYTILQIPFKMLCTRSEVGR